MSRAKTAAYLADCLSHMPKQPDEVQRAIDTVIDGLKRIANGGEWPEEKARAAYWAAWAAWEAEANAAADAADCAAAERAATAAALAADAVADWAAVYWGAAYWAALAHPDPAKERARQAKVREKLGLNTEGAK